MKTNWTHLETARLRTGTMATPTEAHYGFFIFNTGKAQVRAMAADGEETGWEHVSVSVLVKNGSKVTSRMPTWEEMHWIKTQFWDDEECVCQFHPPQSEYVNNHAGCLHLWKCVGQPFPLPPGILVGLKDAGVLTPIG
jgi:hypothetical protein